jgi:hypothetical protein
LAEERNYKNEDSSGSLDKDKYSTESENALDSFVQLSLLVIVSHVRRAMHVLQLVALDGLKNHHAAGLVSKIISVATEARTLRVNKYLRREVKLSTELDQDTRWGSTFVMVDRILQLKQAIVELAGFGNKILE